MGFDGGQELISAIEFEKFASERQFPNKWEGTKISTTE